MTSGRKAYDWSCLSSIVSIESNWIDGLLQVVQHGATKRPMFECCRILSKSVFLGQKESRVSVLYPGGS